MKTLTESQKDRELCIEQFRNLIETEYRIPAIFETLDEVIFEYTKYILRDNCICGGSSIYANQIEILKYLRDIFTKED